MTNDTTPSLREEPEKYREGEFAIEIVGQSMGQDFPSRVKVRPQQHKVRVGEVVAFLSTSQTIVHRVLAHVSIGGNQWFLHKGDASPIWGIVADHEVIGIAESVPRGRVSWLQALKWKFLLLRTLAWGALRSAQNKRIRRNSAQGSK